MRFAKDRVVLFGMQGQTPTPGEALRLLRSMAHLTLQQVASEADTSIAYLSKVERNQLVPTDEYVAKIAAHISTSMLADAA